MRADKAVPFGKYELLEPLGAGGMAAVYRARYTAAPGVSKPVVIKRVLSQYAENPAFVEMFIQEARISVGLSHGNIVQVFDFGQVDGEYFLAMELVEGQPLSRVLKRGQMQGMAQLPAPLAVSIASEMCRGLHHAHTRTDEQGRPLGLVHRDISPDNVLVSYEGEVKISDFGIAKARLAGRPETEVGQVKGKYHYLSPEQARGEPLDARSDVYAVGVVLYRMLCGRLPAEGRQLEVLDRIVEGRLTSPLQLNPELDPLLVQILMRVLSVSREERPESAEALRGELTRWRAQRAPLFTPDTLKHLMEWLYTPELTEFGKPPTLPQEFRDQLPLWCSAPVPSVMTGKDGTAPPVSERVTQERLPETRPGTAPTLPPAPPERPRPVGWGLAFAALAGVIVAVGLTLAFLEGRRPPPLEIRSEPPGAQVSIDGELRGETPLRVEDVARGVPHRVELLLLGWRPWARSFEAGALDTRLEVTLEALPPRVEEPPRAAPMVEREAEEESPVEAKPPARVARSGLRITAAANPSPAIAAAKYKQGMERLASKQFRRAKELFWECLAHDSAASQCFQGLGKVAVQLGNTEEALEYYRRFVELAPDAEGAQEARDYIQLRQGPSDG